MTGFEVLKSIDADKQPSIIFVTAYDQYAIQAFDVHAIDYLLKPFNKERFHRSVERACEQIEQTRGGKIDERLALLIADLKTGKKYLETLVVKSVVRIFFFK